MNSAKAWRCCLVCQEEWDSLRTPPVLSRTDKRNIRRVFEVADAQFGLNDDDNGFFINSVSTTLIHNFPSFMPDLHSAVEASKGPRRPSMVAKVTSSDFSTRVARIADIMSFWKDSSHGSSSLPYSTTQRSSQSQDSDKVRSHRSPSKTGTSSVGTSSRKSVYLDLEENQFESSTKSRKGGKQTTTTKLTTTTTTSTDSDSSPQPPPGKNTLKFESSKSPPSAVATRSSDASSPPQRRASLPRMSEYLNLEEVMTDKFQEHMCFIKHTQQTLDALQKFVDLIDWVDDIRMLSAMRAVRRAHLKFEMRGVRRRHFKAFLKALYSAFCNLFVSECSYREMFNKDKKKLKTRYKVSLLKFFQLIYFIMVLEDVDNLGHRRRITFASIKSFKTLKRGDIKRGIES